MSVLRIVSCERQNTVSNKCITKCSSYHNQIGCTIVYFLRFLQYVKCTRRFKKEHFPKHSSILLTIQTSNMLKKMRK